MNIGLIGSGGREHALCQKLFRSQSSKKIFCFPGNAGTNLIAENVDLDTNNFQKLSEFIIENKIDIGYHLIIEDEFNISEADMNKSKKLAETCIKGGLKNCKLLVE